MPALLIALGLAAAVLATHLFLSNKKELATSYKDGPCPLVVSTLSSSCKKLMLKCFKAMDVPCSTNPTKEGQEQCEKELKEACDQVPDWIKKEN